MSYCPSKDDKKACDNVADEVLSAQPTATPRIAAPPNNALVSIPNMFKERNGNDGPRPVAKYMLLRRLARVFCRPSEMRVRSALSGLLIARVMSLSPRRTTTPAATKVITTLMTLIQGSGKAIHSCGNPSISLKHNKGSPMTVYDQERKGNPLGDSVRNALLTSGNAIHKTGIGEIPTPMRWRVTLIRRGSAEKFRAAIRLTKEEQCAAMRKNRRSAVDYIGGAIPIWITAPAVLK